jgi:hypothetical protein
MPAIFLIRRARMKIFLIILLLSIFPTCGKAPDHQSPSRRSSLQGIWWSPKMFQAAAFQIKDSTIYYPDEFRECRYTLLGDTLFVSQEDGFVLKSVILRVTPDTLVLATEGFEELYTRSETPIP